MFVTLFRVVLSRFIFLHLWTMSQTKSQAILNAVSEPAMIRKIQIADRVTGCTRVNVDPRGCESDRVNFFIGFLSINLVRVQSSHRDLFLKPVHLFFMSLDVDKLFSRLFRSPRAVDSTWGASFSRVPTVIRTCWVLYSTKRATGGASYDRSRTCWCS